MKLFKEDYDVGKQGCGQRLMKKGIKPLRRKDRGYVLI
jgi:hypothetical protein